MRTTSKKTVEQFEALHGGRKIKDLERQLATEKAKVESLAEVQGKVDVHKSDSSSFIFAVTGDRHTGSLYHQPAAVKGFYDYAASCGVKTVFDAGDILAGHHVYRGQEFELRDLGLEAQLARLEKDAPRTLDTRFITGNHDASFKNLAGVPVGKLIQQTVPEYTFLGEEQARVQITTPTGSFTLQLIHPGGGSAYALSYKPQKIVESLEGGTKPNMLAVGHFHKAEFIPSYRNVATLQTGTFERQTPFMARQGLAAHVGGWVVEVSMGESYNIIKTEFVAFYK